MSQKSIINSALLCGRERGKMLRVYGLTKNKLVRKCFSLEDFAIALFVFGARFNMHEFRNQLVNLVV
jgi:hypothetical protein